MATTARRGTDERKDLARAAGGLSELMRVCESQGAVEMLALLAAGLREVGALARSTGTDMATVSRRLSWLRLNELAEGTVAGNRRLHTLGPAAKFVRGEEVCEVRLGAPGGAMLTLGFPRRLVDELGARHEGRRMPQVTVRPNALSPRGRRVGAGNQAVMGGGVSA